METDKQLEARKNDEKAKAEEQKRADEAQKQREAEAKQKQANQLPDVKSHDIKFLDDPIGWFEHRLLCH